MSVPAPQDNVLVTGRGDYVRVQGQDVYVPEGVKIYRTSGGSYSVDYQGQRSQRYSPGDFNPASAIKEVYANYSPPPQTEPAREVRKRQINQPLKEVSPSGTTTYSTSSQGYSPQNINKQNLPPQPLRGVSQDVRVQSYRGAERPQEGVKPTTGEEFASSLFAKQGKISAFGPGGVILAPAETGATLRPAFLNKNTPRKAQFNQNTPPSSAEYSPTPGGAVSESKNRFQLFGDKLKAKREKVAELEQDFRESGVFLRQQKEQGKENRLAQLGIGVGYLGFTVFQGFTQPLFDPIGTISYAVKEGEKINRNPFGPFVGNTVYFLRQGKEVVEGLRTEQIKTVGNIGGQVLFYKTATNVVQKGFTFEEPVYKLAPEFKGNAKTLATEETTSTQFRTIKGNIIEPSPTSFVYKDTGGKGFTVTVTEAQQPANTLFYDLYSTTNPSSSIASVGRRGGTPATFKQRVRVSKAELRKQSFNRQYNPKFTDLGKEEIVRLNVRETNRLLGIQDTKGAVIRKQLTQAESRSYPITKVTPGEITTSITPKTTPAVYSAKEITFKGAFVGREGTPKTNLYSRPPSQVKGSKGVETGAIDYSYETNKGLLVFQSNKLKTYGTVERVTPKRVPLQEPQGQVLVNKNTPKIKVYETPTKETINQNLPEPKQVLSRPGFRPGIAKRLQERGTLKDSFRKQQIKVSNPPQDNYPSVQGNLYALENIANTNFDFGASPFAGVSDIFGRKKRIYPNFNYGYEYFNTLDYSGENTLKQPRQPQRVDVSQQTDITNPFLSLIGKTELRQEQAQTTELKSSLIQELGQESTQVQIQDTALTLNQIQAQELGLEQEQQQQQIQKAVSRTKITFPTVQAKERQKTPERPTIREPITFTTERFPRRTRPPVREPPFKPDTTIFTEPYQPKEEKKFGSFGVFVKTRGKFRSLGTFGSREKALEVGARAVDISPSASFKITGANIGREERVGNKIFKKSKRGEGILIEPSRYRIDTAGEIRGITRKGTQALKLKNLFGGR